MTQMLASEEAAVVATVDPDAYAAAAYNSDEVDMSKWERIQAIVFAGTLGASATLNFKLQSSATSGSGFADITGKAITALTQAGTDDDKQAIINLRSDELPDGHRYVIAVMTVGVAASDAGAVIMGHRPRYAPATDNDLASVDEIIS